MQLNRCPICHSRIGIEALVQDEAGRELLGLLIAMDTETGAALAGYLRLFRSSCRDLTNDKALKLSREVLVLGSIDAVAAAMRQTLVSLQGKSGKPLTNHNYLKRVLEDNGGSDASIRIERVRRDVGIAPTKTSKTAQALRSLEDFGHE